MVRYYFHATDGYSAVFDSLGQRLWGRDLEEVASEVAGEVRRQFGALADLSEWTVVVQDDLGEGVATLLFRELALVERALAA